MTHQMHSHQRDLLQHEAFVARNRSFGTTILARINHATNETELLLLLLFDVWMSTHTRPQRRGTKCELYRENETNLTFGWYPRCFVMMTWSWGSVFVTQNNYGDKNIPKRYKFGIPLLSLLLHGFEIPLLLRFVRRFRCVTSSLRQRTTSLEVGRGNVRISTVRWISIGIV